MQATEAVERGEEETNSDAWLRPENEEEEEENVSEINEIELGGFLCVSFARSVSAPSQRPYVRPPLSSTSP